MEKGSILISLLLLLAVAKLATAGAEDKKEMDWENIKEELEFMLEAAKAKDEMMVNKGVRNLVRLTSNEKMYTLGYDPADQSIKVGVLNYWDGKLKELAPFTDTLTSSDHILFRHDAPQGIIFVKGKNNIKHSNSRMTYFRQAASPIPSTLRVFTPTEGNYVTTSKVSDDRCARLRNAWSKIQSILEKTDAVVLPDDMFCPDAIFDRLPDYKIVTTGMTYTKDGNEVMYAEQTVEFHRDGNVGTTRKKQDEKRNESGDEKNKNRIEKKNEAKNEAKPVFRHTPEL